MASGWKSRRGPLVFAVVSVAVAGAVAVSYESRAHSDQRVSAPAVDPHIPVVPAGSAEFAAVREVADGPCVGVSDVRDIETHECYEVIGSPIARADDVQMAVVADQSCWCVNVVLRKSATVRLDRFIRTAAASELLAIRLGSDAVALPKPTQLLSDATTISDDKWTRIDAQRIVDALSGPRTRHDYAAGVSIPGNLFSGQTPPTVPAAP